MALVKVMIGFAFGGCTQMLMLVEGILPTTVVLGKAFDGPYEVGARVAYLAHINNPRVYKDTDRITGTVEARFPNPGRGNMTYRIQLDIVYPERVTTKPAGSPVVVGNVSAYFMRRLA